MVAAHVVIPSWKVCTLAVICNSVVFLVYYETLSDIRSAGCPVVLFVIGEFAIGDGVATFEKNIDVR